MKTTLAHRLFLLLVSFLFLNCDRDPILTRSDTIISPQAQVTCQKTGWPLFQGVLSATDIENDSTLNELVLFSQTYGCNIYADCDLGDGAFTAHCEIGFWHPHGLGDTRSPILEPAPVVCSRNQSVVFTGDLIVNQVYVESDFAAFDCSVDLKCSGVTFQGTFTCEITDFHLSTD